MRERFKKNGIFIIIFLVLVLYDLIPPIITLSSKIDTYNIVIATKLTTVEDTISGVIPIGKEYYYVGITEDGEAILIRDKKNWLDKNFKYDGSYAISESGVLVKGEKKRTSAEVSYDFQQILEIINQDNEMSFMVKNIYRYTDGLYYDYTIMSIIVGLIVLFAGITGVIVYKKNKIPKNKYFKSIILVLFFIVMCFQLYVLVLIR